MSIPAIELAGVLVARGGAMVLEGIDLAVAPGEVVGIRGFNGSGKSTLLRVAAGLLVPDAGTVRVLGAPPTVRPAPPTVGAAIDAPAPYGWMTARGYLRTLLDLGGVRDDGRSVRALERFGLASTGRKRTFRFSQGMKKRLVLAAATMTDPPVVLLDEPTNALDGAGEALVAAWVRQHRDRGGALLIATHRPVDEACCDRVLVLDGGVLGEDVGQRLGG